MLEHLNNIYTLISVIVISITLLSIFIIIITSGRSFSISKDGLNIYSKKGNFVNKEKSDNEKYEILRITEKIEYLKNIEVISEQMTYIDRELSLYYSENLKRIKCFLKTDSNSLIYKIYQIIYRAQRYDMTDVIRAILKANNLLDRPDWQSYKERQFQYTWSKALELINAYFQDIEIEGRLVITDSMRDQLKNEYKIKFYEWIDEFKKITQEKTKQLQILKLKRDQLLKGVSDVILSE